MNHPQIKSSVVIGRLLASEGYSPKVHNGLRRYSKRLMLPGARRKYQRISRAMSDVCKNIPEGDKLVIGRFIAWQTRMAVDTGLRIGLAASLTTTDDK